MEAEFIAASQAGRGMLGIRHFIQELSIKFAEPIKVKMDNQAAIKQLENQKSMASAKHVNIRFKFICDYAHAQAVHTTTFLVVVAERVERPEVSIEQFPSMKSEVG